MWVKGSLGSKVKGYINQKWVKSPTMYSIFDLFDFPCWYIFTTFKFASSLSSASFSWNSIRLLRSFKIQDGSFGEALDITWSMKSFFAVTENSKSAKSINFGITRKKIENWGIPYKERICLKQWLKSYYQFKVLMTSSKCKGKKHAFLRHLGF